MKLNQFVVLIIVVIFHLQTFALTEGAQQIQGKWVSKKYLPYGLENGKVVHLPEIALKPANFGLFMYVPKQVLEISIPEPKDNSAEKIPGTLQSNQTLLDSSCLRSPVFK
jgi:hypothetical protein